VLSYKAGQRFDALPGEGRMVKGFSVAFQFFVISTLFGTFKEYLLKIINRHLLTFCPPTYQ